MEMNWMNGLHREMFRQLLSGQSNQHLENATHGTVEILLEESFAPMRGWVVSGGTSGLPLTGQSSIDYAQRRQFSGTEPWTVDFWEENLTSKRRLPIKAGIIATHMERLLSLRVPLMVPYVPMVVADGATFFVSFFGGIQAASHFVWRRGSPPKGWEPLQLVIEEMLDCFEQDGD